MTPKEKAKELYNRFYNTSSHPHHVESRINNAKQCALITVDYMDEACGSALSAMGLPTEHIEAISIEYLEDLKKEIQAL